MRSWRVIAQDPAIRHDGKILTTNIELPAEDMTPGPCGARVHVIDYDATTDRLLEAPPLSAIDAYASESDEGLLANPGFHAQNVYAIVMQTLLRFEFALGRRVSWSFMGHQLKVAPHAFRDANAFYSREHNSLLFGYFPARPEKGGTIFSCLSHDVIAHETTHALLDGLRERYLHPSSPDQAAFHEALADLVALLSVLAQVDVVRAMLDGQAPSTNARIGESQVELNALRHSMLTGLAEEMGQELQAARGGALRQSADLLPDTTYLDTDEYAEPHRRAEVLVAAVINAYLQIWVARLAELRTDEDGAYDRDRVVEEGARLADVLLTTVIRAIDYAPPVDLQFSDFLSAVLTADRELRPKDDCDLRAKLDQSCRAYGILPIRTASLDGYWDPPPDGLRYAHTHFAAMRRDPDEVFRFVWENRAALGLHPEAFSRVLSVRPCVRVAPDGFVLNETVAEYVQTLRLRAGELARVQLEKPDGMPEDFEVSLYGGGSLIFDDYGRLKFHIYNHVLPVPGKRGSKTLERQNRRLRYLWNSGFLRRSYDEGSHFAALHRNRQHPRDLAWKEVW